MSALLLLRIISVLEGFSLLYLLYCSIYLKRIKGEAEAIEIPGMIHGVLFLGFALLLLICWLEMRWTIRFSALLFGASFVPFGFLYVEPKLKAKAALRLR